MKRKRKEASKLEIIGGLSLLGIYFMGIVSLIWSLHLHAFICLTDKVELIVPSFIVSFVLWYLTIEEVNAGVRRFKKMFKKKGVKYEEEICESHA
mgnify:CR=1 FL=1